MFAASLLLALVLPRAGLAGEATEDGTLATLGVTPERAASARAFVAGLPGAGRDPAFLSLDAWPSLQQARAVSRGRDLRMIRCDQPVPRAVWLERWRTLEVGVGGPDEARALEALLADQACLDAAVDARLLVKPAILLAQRRKEAGLDAEARSALRDAAAMLPRGTAPYWRFEVYDGGTPLLEEAARLEAAPWHLLSVEAPAGDLVLVDGIPLGPAVPATTGTFVPPGRHLVQHGADPDHLETVAIHVPAGAEVTVWFPGRHGEGQDPATVRALVRSLGDALPASDLPDRLLAWEGEWVLYAREPATHGLVRRAGEGAEASTRPPVPWTRPLGGGVLVGAAGAWAVYGLERRALSSLEAPDTATWDDARLAGRVAFGVGVGLTALGGALVVESLIPRDRPVTWTPWFDGGAVGVRVRR